MVFTYFIPVAGDKVFRSPRFGQKELRSIRGVRRICVDNRDNAVKRNGIDMVKVEITANDQASALACYTKGTEMIKALLPSKSPEKGDGSFTGCYYVPMDADKVFRSPKHGQAQLKRNHSIERIKVDDRANAKKNSAGIELVRVWITAPSQDITDACYQEGRKMVIALMEKAKKEGNAIKNLTDDEVYEKAKMSIIDIIRLREERGEYDHMDDANIRWFIQWSEERGVTNHSDLGMSDYEDPRPVLMFDYPLDDWGEYTEQLFLFKEAHPDHRVIG